MYLGTHWIPMCNSGKLATKRALKTNFASATLKTENFWICKCKSTKNKKTYFSQSASYLRFSAAPLHLLFALLSLFWSFLRVRVCLTLIPFGWFVCCCHSLAQFLFLCCYLFLVSFSALSKNKHCKKKMSLVYHARVWEILGKPTRKKNI